MLLMKIGCILVNLGGGQYFRFAKQIPDETDAGRYSVPGKSVRHDHTGMTGEIGKVLAGAVKGRGDKQIHLLQRLRRFLNQHVTHALGLDIFDRRDEAMPAKNIGPGIIDLADHQIISATAGKIVKRGGGFGRKHKGDVREWNAGSSIGINFAPNSRKRARVAASFESFARSKSLLR